MQQLPVAGSRGSGSCFSLDFSVISHVCMPQGLKKKGLSSKGAGSFRLKTTDSEAVVLPWMREVTGCSFSSTLRSMETPIRVSISPWTPWILALKSAEKNLHFSFIATLMES